MHSTSMSLDNSRKEVVIGVVDNESNKSDFICILSADPLVGYVDASDRLLFRMAANVGV